MYRVTLVLAVFLVSAFTSPASSDAASGSDPICFTDHEECVDPRFADFWRSNDVHAITGEKITLCESLVFRLDQPESSR